jgi:alanine racemase
VIEEPLNGFTGFARKDQHENIRVPQNVDALKRESKLIYDEEKLDAIPEPERRWAWIEIDRSAIRHNTIDAKHHLRPGCRLLAVVKADAYGHGAVECGKTALAAGADYLGVATVDEGIALRKANITAPILMLSEPPTTAIPLLLSYHVMPAIYTVEFAIAYGEEADLHGMKAPYHLAINSGMNRIGVKAEDVIAFMRKISFHRALELVGTFTHFATADCDETLDYHIQLNRFTAAIEALKTAGIDPGIVHAANSAALYRYPEAHFDMARLGISLYGFHPCRDTMGIADLKPAMSIYSRITAVKVVPMSEGVSYGMNYRSPGSVKICTIPIGYADGLRRGLSGHQNVILDGQYCHQVGNICMDQCMFEVDMRSYGTRPRLDPQIGDKVTIIGDEGDAVCTISEMAFTLGTIEHELTIGFSHRLPRIYV